MKNRNSFVIKKEKIDSLKWALLIIPQIKPGYANYLPLINSLYNGCRVISFVYIMLIWVKLLLNNRKLYMNTLPVIFFQGYIFGVTLFYKQDIKQSLLLLFSVVSISLILEYLMYNKPKIAIKSMLIVYEIYTYINILSIILFPEGLYNFEADRISTFLGHANTSIYFILPLLVLNYISYVYDKFRWRYLLNIAVSILTLFLLQSATSLIEFIVFVLILILLNKKNSLDKLTNIKMIFALWVIVSVSVTVFRIQDVFSILIINVLNRSLDFTGRTILWDGALIDIVSSPIIGQGIKDVYNRRFGLGTHNMMLEILYEGGIIGFLLFTHMMLKVGEKTDKLKKVSKLAIPIIAGVSVQMIGGITESNITSSYYYVMVIFAITSVGLIGNCTEKGEGLDG